jgi:hypothetical protein
MKLIMMRNIFFILIIISSFAGMSAQTTANMALSGTDCMKKIAEADKYFLEGQYLKCINDLQSVLKVCSLSRPEKEHSLELLAKALIETDNIRKADSVVNRMLNKFPHYELKEADNFEGFNRLVKKYSIHPLLSIGVRNTMKYIHYQPVHIYSLLDGLDYSVPYSSPGYGFMYYGTGEIEFVKDVSINGDLIFFWSRFDRRFTSPPSFKLNYWEIDNYMHIPVYAKKYFHIGKNVLPYAAAGISWLYMTKSAGYAEISYSKDDLVTGKNADFSASSYNMNVIASKNRNIYEWVAGAGVGYKIKNLRLFIDFRYYGGLNSVNDPSKRLSNTTLVNDYFYVDNKVKMSQFEMGATISYTIINSVKKNSR